MQLVLSITMNLWMEHGYPDGLHKKDIPIEGQIIRVADEYDAIVSKRQYKSHIDISDTLKILIKDSKPTDELDKSNALFNMTNESKFGKINSKILKALFKVVIDDIEFEIYSVFEYTKFLQENIKRLEEIDGYYKKMIDSDKDKDKTYYKNGLKLLLKDNETIKNYSKVLDEYKDAYDIKKEKLEKLNNEIKKIKKFKI